MKENIDFDRWNEVKKETDKSIFKGFINEGQIWWCSVGLNIGREQDGKNKYFERPVLVIKKINRDIAIVVPMSTKNKYRSYYLPVQSNGRPAWVLPSQLRVISTKRFRRHLGYISNQELEQLKDHVIDIFRAS